MTRIAQVRERTIAPTAVLFSMGDMERGPVCRGEENERGIWRMT